MLVQLVWASKAIPNDNPKEAIDWLGLEPNDESHLWALWAALDALLDETDDIDCWREADVESIADLLSHPDFIETANDSEDTYDWSKLPDWVRGQDGILTTA